MVYSSFANYSKKVAHWTIDNTFPSSAGIATATAAVSWYSYQVGMTYSQAPLTRLIVNQMGLAGYAAAPLIIPWLSPIVSSHFSIGVSSCTSLTLNLISKRTLNIKSNAEQKSLTTHQTTLALPIQIPPPIEKPTFIVPAAKIEEVVIEVPPNL